MTLPLHTQVMVNYVTSCVMNIITTFFKSPFSDQSTTVQVGCFLRPAVARRCRRPCLVPGRRPLSRFNNTPTA